MQIINIDFFNITVYSNPVRINKMFILLQKKITQLLIKEIEFYKSTGIYPYHNIQNLIWKFIFGLLIITANKLYADLSDVHFIDSVFEEISSKQSADHS